MDREKYLGSLKESIVNLDFNAVVEVAKEAMDAGVDPHIAITDGMVPGMAIVGEKFESGEYFLSELVVAGEVMKEGSAKRLGKVVIATVEGIIPEPVVHSLKGIGEWLKVNGESIYGATASPIPSPVTAPVQSGFGLNISRGLGPSGAANPNVAPYQCTAKRSKFYIHIFAWPWDGKFKVSRVSKEVKRLYFLAEPNHAELEFNQEGEDVVISVPDKAPDSIDTVVVLEINKYGLFQVGK